MDFGDPQVPELEFAQVRFYTQPSGTLARKNVSGRALESLIADYPFIEFVTEVALQTRFAFARVQLGDEVFIVERGPHAMTQLRALLDRAMTT